jgi:hypothetical protein
MVCMIQVGQWLTRRNCGKKQSMKMPKILQRKLDKLTVEDPVKNNVKDNNDIACEYDHRMCWT